MTDEAVNTSLTNTSKATTTRDLDQLVDIGVLYKEGELKSTSYYPNLAQPH